MFVGREGTRRTGHDLHQAVLLLTKLPRPKPAGIPKMKCICDSDPDHSQVNAPPV